MTVELASDRRPVGDPARVVIAGGGVAALETALALRASAPSETSLTVLTPSPTFEYRPLDVLEPFDDDAAVSVPWERIAADAGVAIAHGALATIDPDARVAITPDGASVGYDFLVVAVGARARPAIPGAITLGTPSGGEALRALAGRIAMGAQERLAIVCPSGVPWTLPAYELALLTAARADGNAEIMVFTAEPAPLSIFGSEASRRVLALLAEREISVYPGTVPEAFDNGCLWIPLVGEVAADAVVALPRFEGPRIDGLRSDELGFLPVDPHGLVVGEDRVYAAGDVTTFPVKQGGLAALQADAVAAHIAARAGADVEPAPFEPVLRAKLLTGSAPLYLHHAPDGETLSNEPLWWPPGKIAGHHIAPYLAGVVTH